MRVITGVEAIQAVAKGTGISEWILARLGLALKMMDLWVRGGQGGGKNARWPELHHLVNFALALASGHPNETVAAVTAQLGDMVPAPANTPFLGAPGMLVGEGQQFLPGDTLRDALALYIAAAATPEGWERAAREHLSVTVYRIGETTIYAGLTALRDGADGRPEQVTCLYQPRHKELTAPSGATAALIRQVSFGPGLIRILADIYRETVENLSTKGEAPATTKRKKKAPTSLARGRRLVRKPCRRSDPARQTGRKLRGAGDFHNLHRGTTPCPTLKI